MKTEDIYFDIGLEFPAVSAGESFEIELLYELQGYKEKDFRIRSTNPNICIVDDLDQCISTFATWDLAPPLANTLRAKVIGNFESPIGLSIEIQNIKTGEIYKTPQRALWKKGHYAMYVAGLNNRLLSEPSTVIESTAGVLGATDAKSNYHILIPLILLVVCVLGFVVLKMIKSRNGSN